MTDEDITRALKDIADLKKSVKSNLNSIRPFMLDRAFIPFSIFGALFFTGVFVLLHVLVTAYGSFSSIPFPLKTLTLTILALVVIVSGIIKQGIFAKILEKRERKMTLRDLYLDPEFSQFYLLTIAGCAGIVLIGAKIALITGSWWLILPIFILYTGFTMGLFALIYHTPEYIIIGLVNAVFGGISLFFMKDAYFLWLAAFCAIFLGVFALVLHFAKGNK